MKRGEIRIVSGGGDYLGKPRPAAIVQADGFDPLSSITLCAFTSDDSEAPLFRPLIQPNRRNGLAAPSRLMVDKITTVRKNRIGKQIGALDDEDIATLDRAVIMFLGLAMSPDVLR